METVQNACWRFAQFPQARRRSINKQQNRTLHLLQKPDIFICYRHSVLSPIQAAEYDRGAQLSIVASKDGQKFVAKVCQNFQNSWKHYEKRLKDCHVGDCGLYSRGRLGILFRKCKPG